MSLRILVPEAMRYGAVGLVVLAIDFTAYALVLAIAPRALVGANLVGKAAGAITGLMLHRSVTFRGRKAHGHTRQAASYLALLVFNAALSSALLWLLVERVGYSSYWSKLGVDVVVVGIAFLGSKLVVWKTA